MRKRTFRQFKPMRLTTKFTIVFLVVFCNAIFLICWFGNSVTPKFVHIAELNINHYIETIASDFKSYSLEKNNSDDFLIIKENTKGEITSIDYDLAKIYEISDRFTKNIQSSLRDSNKITVIPYIEKDLTSKMENGILLSMPMGVISNNIFLTNMGPRVPVFVHFIGSVFTQVNTKVTDYGINNALLDVYLKVKISYEIVTPMNQEMKEIEYDLLIDSKVIQGIVPNWYGKTFESQSAFFEVSFP